MLLTTLDELNMNHHTWNVHRISQSGFCGVGIACDSQRFHSSQYNALHWRSNPDVCWVLEKVRFRLGTWHRVLWWWSLSAETNCQRGGWILQHHRALNWHWMTGLAWGNSSLCVAAVQIIIPAFCTLTHLMLPRSESFGSIFPSSFAVDSALSCYSCESSEGWRAGQGLRWSSRFLLVARDCLLAPLQIRSS